jgi:hypothetical protein
MGHLRKDSGRVEITPHAAASRIVHLRRRDFREMAAIDFVCGKEAYRQGGLRFCLWHGGLRQGQNENRAWTLI